MILLVLIGLVGLALFVGVGLYDIHEINKQRDFKQSPGSKKYRARPLLTVIVMANEDHEAVRQCLDSLLSNRYKKLQIVVVSKATDAKLKQLIAGYRYPIKLYRSKLDSQKAALNAYKRYGKGAVVAIIDGQSLADSRLFQRIVWHLNAEPQADIIIPGQLIDSAYSLLGLFQQYISLLSQLHFKSRSALGILHADRLSNVFYRRDTFLTKESQCRTIYANDALLSTKYPRISFGKMHTKPHSRKDLFATIATTVAVLSLPFFVSYFIYVAMWLHQPTLLLLTVAVFSMYLLFAAWTDATSSFKQKIFYSLLMPVTYGAFYLRSVLQSFVIVGNLIKATKLRQNS